MLYSTVKNIIYFLEMRVIPVAVMDSPIANMDIIIEKFIAGVLFTKDVKKIQETADIAALPSNTYAIIGPVIAVNASIVSDDGVV